MFAVSLLKCTRYDYIGLKVLFCFFWPGYSFVCISANYVNMQFIPLHLLACIWHYIEHILLTTTYGLQYALLNRLGEEMLGPMV